MKIIFKGIHGSHLYGTNTENSDLDYKGIYLPSKKDYYMQSVTKCFDFSTNKSDTRNTKDDIDYKVFSLNYFLNLLKEGDTLALDIIHSPKEMILESSRIWESLQQQRSKFYTKNIKSYVGYCKVQAKKYGIKGSRLDVAEQIIDWCNTVILNSEITNGKGRRIFDFIKTFPDLQYVLINKTEDVKTSYIKIFEKTFMFSDYVESILKAILHFKKEYGQRAELAKNNAGIDYKAVSHAFRAGLQLKEIYQTGDLKYPLVDREFLLNVKLGKFHWINDGIGEQLENLVDEISELSNKSSFPIEVDSEYWDNWLYNNICYEIS